MKNRKFPRYTKKNCSFRKYMKRNLKRKPFVVKKDLDETNKGITSTFKT